MFSFNCTFTSPSKLALELVHGRALISPTRPTCDRFLQHTGNTVSCPMFGTWLHCCTLVVDKYCYITDVIYYQHGQAVQF